MLAQWVMDVITMLLYEVHFMGINLWHAAPGIRFCYYLGVTVHILQVLQGLNISPPRLWWSSLNTLLVGFQGKMAI